MRRRCNGRALERRIGATGAAAAFAKEQNDEICVSPGIHKWSALQKIGVAPGEYVAFGNDSNDIGMLRFARHRVMVGSHPDLAPHADETIPPGGDMERRIAAKIAESAERFA
jgi:hypothetical protein